MNTEHNKIYDLSINISDPKQLFYGNEIVAK
jgi:hypothetical protein